ncbi:MAG: hypothetical protein II625_03315, partial [Bacilli bacterium]|nr:hypothetical protein [Bacilli bacterium]
QALGLNIQIVDQDDNLCDIQDLEHEEEEEAISINEIGKEMNDEEEIIPEPEEPSEEYEDDYMDEEDDFEESLDDIDFPGEGLVEEGEEL